LAGVTAIEKMGGPTVDCALGRADATGAEDTKDGRFAATPGDRLPEVSSKGSDAENVAYLREVFGRMGFDDKELVCLSLSFALGRFHPVRLFDHASDNPSGFNYYLASI
jgi:cytochrome c peroxidase